MRSSSSIDCYSRQEEIMGEREIGKMVIVGLVWGATNALMRREALIWDKALRSSPPPNPAIHPLLPCLQKWLKLLLVWQYTALFLLNLTASATFFAILGTAPISLAVLVTNATTFAATAVFGILLGEETRVVSMKKFFSIEEIDDFDCRGSYTGGSQIVNNDTKRALVGAGARILFYPTLLYNVLRNKIQTQFHWWDEVDQYLLLGAVPFPKDVPRLKQLGVGGVITLYEILVPSSLYHAHEIDHLVIPTRDYLFAPSFVDISRVVDFIHTGRGRSTTIVLCYLVEYKHMTPFAAIEYVRCRRPKVLLAPSQWKARCLHP